MALHVQDPEADRLVREFAARRGLGITEAIKTAVVEATRREKRTLDELNRDLEPLRAEVRALMGDRKFSWEEDKAFMDEMWGEDP